MMPIDPGSGMVGIAIVVALVMVGACIVLPIVAIVRTSRIRHLEQRIRGLEAAMLRLIEQKSTTAIPVAEVPVAVAAPQVPPTPVVPAIPPAPRRAESLETVIGQKWIGWVSVVLILFAAGFFLKYAFENRW